MGLVGWVDCETEFWDGESVKDEDNVNVGIAENFVPGGVLDPTAL